MRYSIFAIFYLSPLILIYFAYYYLGLAGILFMALPYIKLGKLKAQLQDLEAKNVNKLEEENIRKAIVFWQKFTPSSSRKGDGIDVSKK